MKAIKIPNTALLDVFGRTVATNTHDFHRLSHTEHFHKQLNNNHHETNSKSSNATVSGTKLDNSHQLTVIGWFRELKKFRLIFLEFLLGETPLHIAIFYNDIASVKLLVRHGVDVNQRVIASFYSPGQNRNKYETKTGRKTRTSKFVHPNKSSQKIIRLKNANPESIDIPRINSNRNKYFSSCLLW